MRLVRICRIETGGWKSGGAFPPPMFVIVAPALLAYLVNRRHFHRRRRIAIDHHGPSILEPIPALPAGEIARGWPRLKRRRVEGQQFGA